MIITEFRKDNLLKVMGLRGNVAGILTQAAQLRNLSSHNHNAQLPPRPTSPVSLMPI